MDINIHLPKLSFKVSELRKGSIYMNQIITDALKYSVGALEYYLFSDAQKVHCIYLRDYNKNLLTHDVFTNITKLPIYTKSNKHEFIFIVDIIEKKDGFYTTRIYV